MELSDAKRLKPFEGNRPVATACLSLGRRFKARA